VHLPSIALATGAREAAWIAISLFYQRGRYLEATLEEWRAPSAIELALAREIGAGTLRRRLTLDFWLAKIAHRGLSRLKESERALLQLTLYQLAYLERVPAYAAVNESVNLAKRYGTLAFARFLNASSRALAAQLPLATTDDLSTEYSYPPWFIAQLEQNLTEQQVRDVLAAGNQPSLPTARRRPTTELLPLRSMGESIAQSDDFYIQNVTTVELVVEALEAIPSPTQILDLCAAPGGKAILVHDLFPQARLTVNDRSPSRCERLRCNLERCRVTASITCQPGDSFASDQLFDLILLDVPCTNSGVLNKRVEARWRLNCNSLHALQRSQRALLCRGAQLLAPGGHLCYLTCSILAAENEEIVEWAVKALSLKLNHHRQQLPDQDGHDGGFVALLSATGSK
jgi:16S rRNA (cytosine967-C5)-methyltransferase